jgi:hypothetical protein
MNVAPVGNPPTTNTLSFDLEDMRAKAKKFAKNDQKLFDYINNKLNDVNFQNDPKGYMKQWDIRRGHTEEFRCPEDQARNFFDKNFKYR